MAFSAYDYIQRLARRLVLEFDDAGIAPTPGLKGAAREYPARLQLEQLLPGDIGVGSGIVIDSFGGRSAQQDIIIYEKHRCPVFTVNATPEATFYPVEGVIAVGEVKSRLDSATLADAFTKIASAKRLRRYAESADDGIGLAPAVPFRNYGNIIGAASTKDEEFSQDTKSFDQLYGFMLCGEFALTANTAIERVEELSETTSRQTAPNGIFSLKDGYIIPFKTDTWSICRSAMEGNSILHSAEPERSFPQLIWFLQLYVTFGRTVELRHFRRYYETDKGIMVTTLKNARWSEGDQTSNETP